MRPRCVIAVAFALVVSACSSQDAPRTSSKTPVVRFVNVADRDVTDYEYFTGRTNAKQNVEVRARVTGLLDKVNFKAGSDVKKNDVLFVIDPRPYKAALERSKGQVALAEAKRSLSEIELSRSLKIALTPGAISQAEIDKNRADLESAKATVQTMKAEETQAALNLEWTEVKAPMDGLVGRELFTQGNIITQDNTLLTTIVSLDPIFVYFDVDENTLQRIQKLIADGKMQSVKDNQSKEKVYVDFGLSSEGRDYPHRGEIDFVNNQLNASTATLQVRGEIANPKLKGETRTFMPGFFVRVRVPIGPPHKALLVPQSAIGTDQAKKFVYVVDAKNVVERRIVALGARQEDGLQVVEPTIVGQGDASIRAGDRVVVTGLQRIQPGMKVELKAAAEEK